MRFLKSILLALVFACLASGADSSPGSDGMGPDGDPDTPYQVVPGHLQIARTAPVHGPARLTLVLPRTAQAKIALYRVDGRRVALRDLGVLAAGRTEITLDETARLGAGLYIASLSADGAVARRKIVVLP